MPELGIRTGTIPEVRLKVDMIQKKYNKNCYEVWTARKSHRHNLVKFCQEFGLLYLSGLFYFMLVTKYNLKKVLLLVMKYTFELCFCKCNKVVHVIIL